MRQLLLLGMLLGACTAAQSHSKPTSYPQLTVNEQLELQNYIHQRAATESATVVRAGVQYERVRCVLNNLSLAIGLPLDSITVAVFAGTDQINASSLRGGGIIVYDQLLAILVDDDQLAAVLAHELAHLLLHTKIVHHEKSHELEADRLGMLLMAQAGYNPQKVTQLWSDGRLLATYRGLNGTHPTRTQRESKVEELLPAALGLYSRSTSEQWFAEIAAGGYLRCDARQFSSL